MDDLTPKGTPGGGSSQTASIPDQFPGQVLDASTSEETTSEAVTSTENWFGWLVAVLAAVFVLISLNPGVVFANTTPTGGDMGAHVWGPRYLMDHLLPQLRFSGWTPDWYAGFPAYVYYMVVPSLAIVWLAFGSGMWEGGAATILVGLVVRSALGAVLFFGTRWLLERTGDRWFRPLVWVAAVFAAGLLLPVPYNIAFKVVSVSGLVTLPIAVHLFGRAAKVPFPGPPLMAVASVFFIFDKGFTILGGNGASTMAGEFAFSISLTFAFLFLAVVFRGVRTGGERALGAVLFGLTILCHLIPAIFVVIVTVVLLFVRREDRTPWWDANTAGRVVAGVLVVLTLLILMPGDRVPGLGHSIDTALPQWLFPAVASLVALAFFSGFQPTPLKYWREPSHRLVTAGSALVFTGVVVLLTSLGVVDASPWWWALVAIAAIITAFAGWDVRLLRWGVVVGPIGFLLTLWWFLPFYANSTFMNDMGWEKYTRYTDYLLADPSLDSGGMPYRNLVFALAGLGILLVLLHRVRLGYFLALSVMAFAWIFRYFPQYRLWNARLLPFYYLMLYLLASLAIALVVRSVAIAVLDWWGDRRRASRVAMAGTALAVLASVVVLLGGLGWLPGGTHGTDPNNAKRPIFHWAGMSFDTAILNGWATWNYAGLERKDAFPEFRGLIETMDEVGREHGCGRAMWEYESDMQRYGTPMALMLLPYFTDGCIGSMEGLYFESSTTTPFHFLNQNELSAQSSSAQRELPYQGFDIERGIAHLQMLGVRYYMATSDQAIEAARSLVDDGKLREVADRTFTYTDSNTGEVVSQDWVVFQVADADVVAPLENEPVVLEGADDHIDGWVYDLERLPQTEDQAAQGIPGAKTSGPAVRWYMDPSRWGVLLATSGPESWARVDPDDPEVAGRPVPEVEVSDVELGDDSVSFRVDRTGVPVLVKVSYFPNWSASGAEGPYRVSPNFMVVVPTENQVTLTYGRTGADWLGTVASLIGLALACWVLKLDHDRRGHGQDARDGEGDDHSEASGVETTL